MKYCLIRTRRRSIAIRVTKDGQLVVRAPHWLTSRQIEGFVQTKSAWITRAQAKREDEGQRAQILDLEQIGNWQITLLGRSTKIRFDIKTKKPVWRDDLVSLPAVDPLLIPALFKNWFYQTAETYFKERCEFWSEKTGLTFTSLGWSKATSRWGSCSSKGRITLSRRLIFASEAISDYVIVHELCHLKEANHSPRFWRLVGLWAADYKNCRSWLRQNGSAASLFIRVQSTNTAQTTIVVCK